MRVFTLRYGQQCRSIHDFVFHANSNTVGKENTHTHDACHTYNIKQTNLKSIGKKRKLEKWFKMAFSCGYNPKSLSKQTKRKIKVKEDILFFPVQFSIVFSLSYITLYFEPMYISVMGTCELVSLVVQRSGTSTLPWRTHDVTHTGPMRKRGAQRSRDDVIGVGIIINAAFRL